VTRVSLRPWQQAVFWGLRVYIVVMLGVMAVGFAKVAGR
jgi:predicted cobalt transporter CbtA